MAKGTDIPTGQVRGKSVSVSGQGSASWFHQMGRSTPRPRWSEGVPSRGHELTRCPVGSWPQIVQTRFPIAIFCAPGPGPVSEPHVFHGERGKNWPLSQVASQTALILQMETTGVSLGSSVTQYPKYLLVPCKGSHPAESSESQEVPRKRECPRRLPQRRVHLRVS